MINRIYRLTSPRVFDIQYEEVPSDGVLLRPVCMSVCRADQRYYAGLRPTAVLREKLPMALIHECAARVVHDATGQFSPGDRVVLIPNIPPKEDAAPGIYENYASGSGFRSSGRDGFLSEYVTLPADRVVKTDGIPETVAASCELFSVCVHAITRFLSLSHKMRERIGVWGDGSVAYYLCVALREMCPDSRICVVGKSPVKLAYFPFCDEIWDASELPADFSVDHAFECCGGEGSAFAFDDIIRVIRPQGTVLMMGVSENKVPLLTRMILEKGLTFVGSSRSGREDFCRAVDLLQRTDPSHRIECVCEYFGEVRNVTDLHAVFDRSMTAEFKTVFRWNI